MSSPRTPNPSGIVGRQRRSAVRYTNLEKATSSPILTKPNRTVNFDPSIVEPTIVATIAGMQGWRKTMEDRHALCVFPATTNGHENNDHVVQGGSDSELPSHLRSGVRGALMAVFDGHRGTDAAAFASDLLPQALLGAMAGHTFDFGDGDVEALWNESDSTALTRITNMETLQRVFVGVDAKLRRIWEEQSLLSSRAASLETPPFGENGSLAAASTSGEYVSHSNQTSGQSSPQELSCSTLRAPPTIPGSGDSSTITGTTATIAIVLDEAYVFINVGDSRCYLVTRRDCNDERGHLANHDGSPADGKETTASSEGTLEQCDSAREHLNVVLPAGLVTMATSKDHRTSDVAECARVEAAGGCVISGRVNGKLSVTRALGDFDLKPNLLDVSSNPVVCTPDVVQIPRTAAAPSRSHAASMKRRGTAQFDDAPLLPGEGEDGDVPPSVFEYDLLVVGCDGVWELQSIDSMALLVDQKLQEIAATLNGTTPTDRELFGARLEAVLKEAVSELLVKCCAQSCDPNGTTLGADNMSLGLMVLPLHA